MVGYYHVKDTYIGSISTDKMKMNLPRLSF